MANFLAVIKLTASSSPSKVNFEARNVKEAIDRMLAATKVHSTMDLHEYEMLEVVPGGYRPVAMKGPPMAPRVVEQAVIGTIVPAKDERAYTSYSIVAAI